MPGPVLGKQYAANGAWVITIQGDLDVDTLAPLQAAMDKAATALPVVVLDATRVTFGDSSFLNLLLRFHQRTALRVAAVPPQLQRLFELTGADQVLDIRPSVARATAP